MHLSLCLFHTHCNKYRWLCVLCESIFFFSYVLQVDKTMCCCCCCRRCLRLLHRSIVVATSVAILTGFVLVFPFHICTRADAVYTRLCFICFYSERFIRLEMTASFPYQLLFHYFWLWMKCTLHLKLKPYNVKRFVNDSRKSQIKRNRSIDCPLNVPKKKGMKRIDISYLSHVFIVTFCSIQIFFSVFFFEWQWNHFYFKIQTKIYRLLKHIADINWKIDDFGSRTFSVSGSNLKFWPETRVLTHWQIQFHAVSIWKVI